MIRLISVIIVASGLISANGYGGFTSINAMGFPIGMICQIDETTELHLVPITGGPSSGHVLRKVNYAGKVPLIEKMSAKLYCQAGINNEEPVTANRCYGADREANELVKTLPQWDKIHFMITSATHGNQWMEFSAEKCRIEREENIFPIVTE